MKHFVTAEQIAKAKSEAPYSRAHVPHFHDDGIRAAYVFLDVQRKLLHPTSKAICWKHAVEWWAGFNVSQADVEVAAHMHPEVFGRYPYYNIHANYVHPADCRLVGLESISNRRPRVFYNEWMYFEHPQRFQKKVYVRWE